MKIVFTLMELKEDLEDAAGHKFEAQGGDLGDSALVLSRINLDTQDLLFTLGDDQPEVLAIDMSPTVTDERAGVGPTCGTCGNDVDVPADECVRCTLADDGDA